VVVVAVLEYLLRQAMAATSTRQHDQSWRANRTASPARRRSDPEHTTLDLCQRHRASAMDRAARLSGWARSYRLPCTLPWPTGTRRDARC